MGRALTATNLAVYHHFNCDLFLHKTYHGSESRPPQPSELSKAQFKRGNDWEHKLFSWLDENELLLTIPSTPLHPADLVENLKFDDRDHFFLAGLTFWPPKDALKSFFDDAGSNPVDFALAKPDLLEITKVGSNWQWKVIDAKASSTVKSSHHVQLYWYDLCLRLLLTAPDFIPSDTAAIWLPPVQGFDVCQPSFEDVKPINLDLISSSVNDFLFRRVPAILARPWREVAWHFNPLCRGCPYTSDCRSRAMGEGELGSMSNITLDDARILRDLLHVGRSQPTTAISDIEDLHQLLSTRSTFDRIGRTSPLTMKRAKRILALPAKITASGPISSPIVNAARFLEIQLIPQRNYMLPLYEDVAVILSLLQDPSTPGSSISSFSIFIFAKQNFQRLTQTVSGRGSQLIGALADVLRKILDIRPPEMLPLTQVYVFSPAEHTALQEHLVNSALAASDSREDTRLCIGAISQGASLLQTTFQPTLLSGALLEFLAKKTRTKAELQHCLERLELPIDGTISVLRKRIQDSIKQHQDESRRTAGSEARRKELGQLPRVVTLKKEIEKQLALPIPGFWDLPECAAALLSQHNPAWNCPSEEEIYEAYTEGGGVYELLEQRNRSIFAVLEGLRERIASSGQELLVNKARILSTNFMDICHDDNLRKLFFMQQFEVLSKLSELWKARIDGCPQAPVLEFQRTAQGSKGIEHIFRLVSGALDMAGGDKERSFFDYLLVYDQPDETANQENQIPVEALFDDLGVSGLVFPLTRYTRPKWSEQHPTVQRKLMLADLNDLSVDGRGINVTLRTWGGSDLKLTPGHHYRISPRLVDFNITKILSTLVEMDFQLMYEDVPFLQLLVNPRSLANQEQSREEGKHIQQRGKKIQSLFKTLSELGVEPARSLVLKQSQDKAAQRILSSRLSVIWGPPGTGKTHTLALSLLRLLEIQYSQKEPSRRIIFLTAMTHAAITACLNKLSQLIECYRAIESLPTEWLDNLDIQHVLKASDHAAPRSNAVAAIYAGTVFQLYNFSKKYSFQVDCVVIDEGGQLALSSAALVLRALSDTGKIIVAGDSEQLAPILSAAYPQLNVGYLFGSLLDCLMYWSKYHQSAAAVSKPESSTPSEIEGIWSQETIVQLTENFRLNPDLGDFVSTIYSRAFKSQKSQVHQLAVGLSAVSNDLSRDLGLAPSTTKAARNFLIALSQAMRRRPQQVLAPPVLSSQRGKEPELDPQHLSISLALIRLRTISNDRPESVGYELHVKGEAMLAASLVVTLQRCFPEEDVFVATPHRVQRQAVNAALAQAKDHVEPDEMADVLANLSMEDDSQPGINEEQSEPTRTGSVTVDTVERLQGAEAAFVICLFSLPQSATAELPFILERRRLNVAISRAKTLCILVSSSEVLQPSIKVLANEANAKGFAFLKAFEKRSWSATISVDVEKL